eukprot:6848610-Prymnesium_polylepis.1
MARHSKAWHGHRHGHGHGRGGFYSEVFIAGATPAQRERDLACVADRESEPPHLVRKEAHLLRLAVHQRGGPVVRLVERNVDHIARFERAAQFVARPVRDHNRRNVNGRCRGTCDESAQTCAHPHHPDGVRVGDDQPHRACGLCVLRLFCKRACGGEQERRSAHWFESEPCVLPGRGCSNRERCRSQPPRLARASLPCTATEGSRARESHASAGMERATGVGVP